MNRASILGISRLRMGTDGHGITDLVAFHGCTLHCKYCLNPRCFAPQRAKQMSADEVMQEIEKDELYYMATDGGVTFGGGEPLLNSHFIIDVLELGAKQWNVTVETSLNVPFHHIVELLPYVDEYIVDIKDMNPEIYERYTGRNNDLVKSNLKYLIEKGPSNNITCRIPLIPEYNDDQAQERSKEELTRMGIKKFDLFTYITAKI